MSCYSMAPPVLAQCNLNVGLLALPIFYAPSLDSNADFSKNYLFCSADCTSLYNRLAFMVAGVRMEVPNFYIDILRNKSRNSDANTVINQCDVKFVFIRCKDASEENKLLLTEVVNIFHDCFIPITNSSTGEDFIDSMAKGKC